MKDFKSFLIGFLMVSSMYAGFFDKVENPNGTSGLLTIGYDVESKSPYATLPIFNFLTFKFQSGRDGYLINNLRSDYNYYEEGHLAWGNVDCHVNDCNGNPDNDAVLLTTNDYIDLSKSTFILEFHVPLWSKK